MLWSLKLVTPPATEPLLVEDAKEHLRVDQDSEDNYITGLCLAARMTVEEHLSRSLHHPDMGAGRATISLAGPNPASPWPGAGVNRVIYTDSTLTSFTMVEGTDYLLDLSQDLAEIILPFGTVWPTAVLSTAHPIVINFTGGYGDNAADVLAPIGFAAKQLIGDWYENRRAVTVGLCSGRRRDHDLQKR